ncbi:MAG: DUF721 domain-containing protein, partial [Nitrospinota bacterium]
MQDSLASALKSVSLGKLAELAKISGEWRSIVGEDLAKICKPAYIREETLIVEVFDTAFMEPLEYLRLNIVEAIVRQTGKEIVRD